MMISALTLNDVAAELGRSPDWLSKHWREEVKLRGMPAPIHERGGLVWSAPGLWAWLDRDLDPAQRTAAAAYRAAYLAAKTEPDDEVSIARRQLDEQFGIST